MDITKFERGTIAVSQSITDAELKDIFGINSRDGELIEDGALILEGTLKEFRILISKKIPCKTLSVSGCRETLHLFDGVREKGFDSKDGKALVKRNKLKEIISLLEDDNEELALVKLSFIYVNEKISEYPRGDKLHNVRVMKFK